MEFTDDVVKEMLSELGLELKKVRNTPANVGRSPELILAREINTQLYGIGVAIEIEGRARQRAARADVAA